MHAYLLEQEFVLLFLEAGEEVRGEVAGGQGEVSISDGSVVSFQKTAVAVLASNVVFLITAVAVIMRLC